MAGIWLVGIYVVSLIGLEMKAQNLILPLHNHDYEHLAVDEQKNLYLLNPKQATLTKYFFNQNYDSSIVVGGRNLSMKESFVKPSEMIIPDSKTLFIIDILANDIKFLNTNLKIQKVWNFNQIQDEYQPFQLQTATIAPTGEMFIQNKLNSMIYRVNVFGEIDRSIGGNNFAEASITDYAHLTCTKDGLWVWVNSEKKLYQFDLNANFKKNIQLSKNFENIISDHQNLFAYEKNQIFLIYKNESIVLLFEHPSPIIDLYIRENQIYILDSKGIWSYSMKNSK